MLAGPGPSQSRSQPPLKPSCLQAWGLAFPLATPISKVFIADVTAALCILAVSPVSSICPVLLILRRPPSEPQPWLCLTKGSAVMSSCH